MWLALVADTKNIRYWHQADIVATVPRREPRVAAAATAEALLADGQDSVVLQKIGAIVA